MREVSVWVHTWHVECEGFAADTSQIKIRRSSTCWWSFILIKMLSKLISWINVQNLQWFFSDVCHVQFKWTSLTSVIWSSSEPNQHQFVLRPIPNVATFFPPKCSQVTHIFGHVTFCSYQPSQVTFFHKFPVNTLHYFTWAFTWPSSLSNVCLCSDFSNQFWLRTDNCAFCTSALLSFWTPPTTSPAKGPCIRWTFASIISIEPSS